MPRTTTRSSRTAAITRRTSSRAASVALTFTSGLPLEADDLVPELLLLGGDLVDPHVLHLEVLGDAPRPELPAHARLLVPAVRRGGGEEVPVVDPHAPRAQPPGHIQRPVN